MSETGYGHTLAGVGMSGAVLLEGDYNRELPPPPAPLPELQLTFGGVALTSVAPLPFVPGRAGFADHGKSPIESRPVAGFTLSWLSNQPNPGCIGRQDLEAAMSAAKVELTKVREGFRTHPLYTRWRVIAAKLSELQTKTKDVEEAPARALAGARAAILRGEDPTVAEACYVKVAHEQVLHANRVMATTAAEAQARRNAEHALAGLLDEARGRLEAVAKAEAQKIADEIDAFVRERIETFATSHIMAGRCADDERIASRFGGGGRITDPYRELP